ncbi:pre-mRNA-splicing factor ISY1 homolog [Sabethes cyaneus]|uniref:pre-mRNA-splicing factor ISY1 homolog n=1 Tax=Sabethes cyaneus TaxID=53552 RepID=UPI00237D8183|nr:pre-mRNA-splicing factor ISY1 homolog [Sabethes cyaneus]
MAQQEAETGRNERPLRQLGSECADLGQCEKWRLQIIQEISKKVAQIQNAGLGEFRIRDLNDEINRLLREKRHWENRIADLGGPHYRRYGPKMFEAEGREVSGNRGYMYFGAAKHLPGVRELFEQEAPPPPSKKARAELLQNVDAYYYGFLDDDDGIPVPLEAKAEAPAIRTAVDEWKQWIGRVSDARTSSDANRQQKDDPMMGLLGPTPRPSQEDIEAGLQRKRKLELFRPSNYY